MRRIAIGSLFLLAVTVAGCSSKTATQRTVTVVNTVTSSSVAASRQGGASSVIVVSPSAPSKTTAKSTTSATPKPTPTTASVTAAPIVKIDPLKADCASTLDAADIKKAINGTVGSTTNRIRLSASDKGSAGGVRCLYGSKDGGKTAPVRIRITQYSSAAAAKKQIGIDIQAAQDAGAKITKTTVNGYPATLSLIAGGVIEMQYDTWALSVAVSDHVTTPESLAKGLPILAGQALSRIVKNA